MIANVFIVAETYEHAKTIAGELMIDPRVWSYVRHKSMIQACDRMTTRILFYETAERRDDYIDIVNLARGRGILAWWVQRHIV